MLLQAYSPHKALSLPCASPAVARERGPCLRQCWKSEHDSPVVPSARRNVRGVGGVGGWKTIQVHTMSAICKVTFCGCSSPPSHLSPSPSQSFQAPGLPHPGGIIHQAHFHKQLVATVAPVILLSCIPFPFFQQQPHSPLLTHLLTHSLPLGSELRDGVHATSRTNE